MTFKLTTFALIINGIAASNRNPNQPLGGPRNIIVVNSHTDFCMFLPPKPSITIAESEGYPLASPEEASKWAVSFCTQPNPNAPDHQLFYEGFITGAHFKKTETTVELTGTINADAAGLPKDGGGYYDFDMNVNSPPGGLCYGYDSFYNAVNPLDGIFCIKCCKGIAACRIDLGGGGCNVMVPGNYSATFDNNISPPKTGRILGVNQTSSSSGNVSAQSPSTGNSSSKTEKSDALQLSRIFYATLGLVSFLF